MAFKRTDESYPRSTRASLLPVVPPDRRDRQTQFPCRFAASSSAPAAVCGLLRGQPCPSWPFSISFSCVPRRADVACGASGVSSSAEVPVFPPLDLLWRIFPDTAHRRTHILRMIFRPYGCQASWSFRPRPRGASVAHRLRLEWLPVGIEVEAIETERVEDLREPVGLGVGSCRIDVEGVVERTAPGGVVIAAILDAGEETCEDQSTEADSHRTTACRGCFVECWERS